MRRLPHTKKFSAAILDSIAPIIERASKQEHDNISAGLMDTLHGRKRSTVKTPKLSRDELFAMKMFRSFSEIHSCIERLKDIETMVSRYRMSGTRVTRAAYLRFVIEGQLHELYVVQERLIKWLVVVQRAYRADARASAIATVIQTLSKAVQAQFKPIATERGSHVHQFRYDNEDIGRLELIDLLLLGKNENFTKAIRSLKKAATNETHLRLKQQVLNWNKIATDAIEAVHEILYKILFAASEAGFRYPSPKKKHDAGSYNLDQHDELDQAVTNIVFALEQGR